MAAKGDFQMSIGMLVTVIFAVVLLALGIQFIMTQIGGITDLTEIMKQQAKEKLDESFKASDKKFTIYPPEWTVKPATKITVTAGIKNTDTEDHQYAVGISVEKEPVGVTKAEVKSWIKFVEAPQTIVFGDTSYMPIVIEIPKTAKKDSYFFRISACYDKDGALPISGACTANSANIWSTSQNFILTVQ